MTKIYWSIRNVIIQQKSDDMDSHIALSFHIPKKICNIILYGIIFYLWRGKYCAMLSWFPKKLEFHYCAQHMHDCLFCPCTFWIDLPFQCYLAKEWESQKYWIPTHSVKINGQTEESNCHNHLLYWALSTYSSFVHKKHKGQ